MKNNKKGFTIVELVIVIAVIAILAGVLIPTFAGIVSKAKKSAAEQEAANAYKEAYALAIADGKIEGETEGSAEVVIVGDYQFTFSGALENPSCDVAVESTSDSTADGYTVTVVDGKVKVAETAKNATEPTWTKATEEGGSTT